MTFELSFACGQVRVHSITVYHPVGLGLLVFVFILAGIVYCLVFVALSTDLREFCINVY
jgi:hypothetical protein